MRFLCVLDWTCNTHTTAVQVSLVLNSRKRWRPDKPWELSERRNAFCSQLDFCLESLHQYWYTDIYRYYHCHYMIYIIQSWVILHQSHWAVVLAQHHGAVWHRWTYDTYDIVISSMTLDTLELMAWLFWLTSKAQIMSPDPDQPSVFLKFFFFWDLRCWMTLMLL